MSKGRVEDFLADIRASDFSKYEIIEACRTIMKAAAPGLDERIIYGGIMFQVRGNDIGGVFASKHHVSFEFGNGYLFNDPQKQLEGKGKFRRHLKLRSLADIEEKTLPGFVAQALAG